MVAAEHEYVRFLGQLEAIELRSGRTQYVEVIQRGAGRYVLLSSRLAGEQRLHRPGGLWVSRYAAPFVVRGLQRFIDGDYPGAPGT